MTDASPAPLVLVGNALAVQVAALERAALGLPTRVVNPGGPWGGYFAGLNAGGRRWDAGMVMYEFTSFTAPAEAPPLAGYDPLRRNDIGRFCATVQSWVARHQATRTIAMPQMWTGDRVLPDLLLANGLEALAQLPCADAARAELRRTLAAAQASPWHASRKLDWAGQGGPVPDFDTASRLNHGQVLHDSVFAPFARQVLGRDAGHISADFHRIPWLPLYWPQTLLRWLDGTPQPLPPTEFSHPQGAAVADLCAGLAQKMAQTPGITLSTEKIVALERTRHGFVLQLERSGRVVAARLGWAQTPRQGLAAAGDSAIAPAEQRLPLTLTLLRLPAATRRHGFSVLHSIDADTGFYRVTDASDCAGTTDAPQMDLVTEANTQVLAERLGPQADDAAVVGAMLDGLARAGLVAAGTEPVFAQVLRIPGALPLPTAETLARFVADRHQLLRRLPGVELIGASAGPFATSLSDQIVGGLQLAARCDMSNTASNAAHLAAA
jgi:hypothetical protein